MKAKIPHRCWRCWRRFSLRFLWWSYKRRVVCPSCGRGDSIFVDKDRLNRNKDYGPFLCLCHGYHYPHRVGSGKCVYGSDPLGMHVAPEIIIGYTPEEGLPL